MLPPSFPQGSAKLKPTSFSQPPVRLTFPHPTLSIIITQHSDASMTHFPLIFHLFILTRASPLSLSLSFCCLLPLSSLSPHPISIHPHPMSLILSSSLPSLPPLLSPSSPLYLCHHVMSLCHTIYYNLNTTIIG